MRDRGHGQAAAAFRAGFVLLEETPRSWAIPESPRCLRGNVFGSKTRTAGSPPSGVVSWATFGAEEGLSGRLGPETLPGRQRSRRRSAPDRVIAGGDRFRLEGLPLVAFDMDRSLRAITSSRYAAICALWQSVGRESITRSDQMGRADARRRRPTPTGRRHPSRIDLRPAPRGGTIDVPPTGHEEPAGVRSPVLQRT